MRMRISMGMVMTVRNNSKQKYKNRSLSCPSCKKDNADENKCRPIDTQTHLLEECEAFQDIRDELDTDSDEGIVTFFTKVVERRVDMEED